MLLWFPHRGFGLLAGLSLSAHGFHPSHIGLGVRYFFLKLAFLTELFMQQFCRLAIEKYPAYQKIVLQNNDKE